MKTKIFTQLNPPKRIPTPCGDAYLDVFQEEITKDGKIDLVCIGKTNINDKIQEDLESTKIENILKAVVMGDLSALRKEEPLYIDATTFPKTLMEAQNIVVKAKQEFEKFPQEVKDLFDNSPELYVSQMGTKEYLNKLAPYNDKIDEIKRKGSAEEYNKKVMQQAKFESDVAKAKEVNVNES